MSHTCHSPELAVSPFRVDRLSRAVLSLCAQVPAAAGLARGYFLCLGAARIAARALRH
jgi:hypothetical protein